MNQHDVRLVHAAARLARTAPESWKELTAAVQAYSANQTQSCIQSPLDILPVAQGRAQTAARLAALLADCIELADKHRG